MRPLIFSAGVFVMGIASLHAQGPLYDKVTVNMPYTITIGDKTLQPGDYVIRELPSAAKSRVLLIYSDSGMKFETSAMTIPALDNRTPEDTKVVLHHFGSDYFFDKIWIQGKSYGYEFPLPDSVKARMKERMEPMNVAARYEAVPSEANQQQTAASTAENTQAQTTAETQSQPAQPETRVAQARPEPAPAPAPEPAPAAEANTADRAMPATGANWLMMLLSGGAFSGAGLALRRRR